MNKQTKTLEELVKELPPELGDEVRDFVEFLLARQDSVPRGNPEFAWAGALRDLQDRYTAVDLQHQIARWRIQSE